MPFTLEVEHGVYQVLEDTGSGEGTLLGDVTHDERGQAPALGHREQAASTLPHLRHTPRRRLQLRQVDGLDGIDDQRVRPDLVEARMNPREVVLSPEEQAIAAHSEAIGAQLDLRRRLLGRDIEHGRIHLRQRSRCLQEQGALAGAGFTTDQHQ